MPSILQDYAVMVICAADVDQIWHDVTNNGAIPGANPALPRQATLDPTMIGYVHDGNFDAVGQLRCDDVFITKQNDVYYALVLIAKQAVGPVQQGDLLIAVRGTMDQLEWMNDAASLVMGPGYPDAKGEVGAGFWQVYASMTYGDLAGNKQPGNAADALVAIALQHPNSGIFVCGHSLGAALATYLAYDLNEKLGAAVSRLRPYFFASPKTGTSDWVNWYQKQLVGYDLSNYALDFVPMVPPDGDTLNPGGSTHNVHIIPALSPGALDVGPGAPFDPVKNHSPIGYARMLDPTNPVAGRLQP